MNSGSMGKMDGGWGGAGRGGVGWGGVGWGVWFDPGACPSFWCDLSLPKKADPSWAYCKKSDLWIRRGMCFA